MVFKGSKKKNWQWLVLSGLALFICPVAQSANLIEVYQLALKNDAHLQAIRFEFKASREAIDQAIADLLPQLSFNYTHTESRQEIISSQNSVFANAGVTTYPIDTYDIKLNVPVFHYDSWIRFSQSEAVTNQARAELLAAEQELILDVAQAYFDILAAQDDLQYALAEKKALQKQLDLALTRLKQGLGTENDLMDIKARVASAQMREIDTQNALQDALHSIQELTLDPVTTLDPLMEEIPLEQPESVNIQDWLDLAYIQNYKLRAKHYAIAIAENEKQRQFAGHLPTLDLVGTLNNRKTGGSLFGGGSEVQTFNVNLQLNVPIFQGGKVLSKTREAGYRFLQAKREFEVEKRSLKRQTYAAFKGVLSGIEKIKATKKVVEYQLNSLILREEGLRAGLNTIQAVLDVRRDLYFAQKDYSLARYDYLLNILKLKLSNGTLSPDDLVSLNRLLKTN